MWSEKVHTVVLWTSFLWLWLHVWSKTTLGNVGNLAGQLPLFLRELADTAARSWLCWPSYPPTWALAAAAALPAWLTSQAARGPAGWTQRNLSLQNQDPTRRQDQRNTRGWRSWTPTGSSSSRRTLTFHPMYSLWWRLPNIRSLRGSPSGPTGSFCPVSAQCSEGCSLAPWRREGMWSRWRTPPMRRSRRW